jgi:hypothetical protein
MCCLADWGPADPGNDGRGDSDTAGDQVLRDGSHGMDTNWWYVDPAERFQEIASGNAQPVIGTAGASPSLTAAAIEDVITQERNMGATAVELSTALTRHIAHHSLLTVDAAEPIVLQAMTSSGGDAARAVAVSAAVAGVAVSGRVDLSDPVMLGPAPRMLAAALLGAIAILSAVFADHLTGASWIAYLAMILFGILGILGIVIMVMGYRTVSISGSSTPSVPPPGR